MKFVAMKNYTLNMKIYHINHGHERKVRLYS